LISIYHIAAASPARDRFKIGCTGKPAKQSLSTRIYMNTENLPLKITSNGEEIFRTEESIYIRLPPGRSVLSTSWVNGGYRENLTGVFNHQPPHHALKSHDLEGGSVEAYLALVSGRLGLDPDKTAGLLTAARMKHAAAVTKAFRGVEVTAVVTAGIEVNGGRAGDPASYFQENGAIEMISGTINTLLLIGADLPEYTMTRAVITATEAKTAVLQELMAPSRYSSGIATGSGTDGIAVVADTTHEKRLTDAGKHAKLGELIGRAIMEATRLALERQSHLSPASQQDIMVRLNRLSIGEEEIWTRASSMSGENRKPLFIRSLRETAKDPALLSAATGVIHIMDEIDWGLLPETAGQTAAKKILCTMPEVCGTKPDEEFLALLGDDEPIVEHLQKTIAWIAKQREREE